jgi:hypothetical protein
VSAENLTQKEIYEMLRAQMEHEDRLIDNRVNWLLVGQGLLFVAYATILSLAAEGKLSLHVIYVVAAVGIILNFFGLIGIAASHLHTRDLIEFWKQPRRGERALIKASRDEFPPIVGGTKYHFINGGFGSTLTPIVFGIAWVFLLIFVRF